MLSSAKQREYPFPSTTEDGVALCRQLGKAEAPYRGTSCGTRWAVPVVSPFHPQTHSWCFTNSPQRQKFPIFKLCTKTQISSEGDIHVLMLSQDGHNNIKLFFVVKRNSRNLAPILPIVLVKTKQNHSLTHEFRQPALQTQKEKTLSVEKGSFSLLTAEIFHMVWIFFLMLLKIASHKASF